MVYNNDVEDPSTTNSTIGDSGITSVNLNNTPTKEKSLKKVKSFKQQNTVAWNITLDVKTTRKEQKETGKATKRILHNVCGEVKSGQMLAVMGSSGAGKSSFLDAVSLRNQKWTGSVWVNGKPADEKFFFMTGYIYQEDLFFPTMTVKEHLIFNALVRMDSKIPVARRLARVDEVLVEVAMNHCPNTLIGGQQSKIRGISGGEKKRLAFGTELLNDPSVIFADEPTSGLDSFMAKAVCKTMRKLVADGKIVMCVIHQPSPQTFDLFTHVLFLAKGHTMYLGTLDKLNEYFKTVNVICPQFYNPADFYIQQLSVIPTKYQESMEKLERLWNAYDASSLNIENSAWKQGKSEKELSSMKYIPMKNFHATTQTQFYYTFRRNILTQLRQPTEFKAKLLNSVFMGIILGLVYFNQGNDQASVQNKMGLFFILCMYQCMTSMFGVLQVFPAEVKIFIRENLSGANRVSSYFYARVISDLPNHIFFPIIFGSITYWMVNLRADPHAFFSFVLTMIAVANSSVALGYMISAMTKHEAVAYALAPLFLMPMSLFAGLLLDLNDIPVWLHWADAISIIKYGYQSFIIAEYEGVKLNCAGVLFCRWQTGDTVMEYVGTDPEDFSNNFLNMLYLMIGFYTLSLLFLTLRAQTGR